MALTPCNDCRRHLKNAPGSCPFCGAAQVARPTGAGMALLAAAGLSLGLAACTKEPPPQEPSTIDVPNQGNTDPFPGDQPVADTPVAEPAEPEPTEPAPVATVDPPAPPAADDPNATPAPTGTTTKPQPPKYDRPMMARYGVAPRPRPTSPRPVARYGVAPRPITTVKPSPKP